MRNNRGRGEGSCLDPVAHFQDLTLSPWKHDAGATWMADDLTYIIITNSDHVFHFSLFRLQYLSWRTFQVSAPKVIRVLIRGCGGGAQGLHLGAAHWPRRSCWPENATLSLFTVIPRHHLHQNLWGRYPFTDEAFQHKEFKEYTQAHLAVDSRAQFSHHLKPELTVAEHTPSLFQRVCSWRER